MRLAEATEVGPIVIDAAYVEQELYRPLPVEIAETTVSNESVESQENGPNQ